MSKLANVIWGKAFDSVEPRMRKSGLIKEYPIPQNTGNTREFSEIDSEEYADNKGQGAQAERAKVQQGYTKIMYQKRIAKDIGITYEDRTQNKYPEVTARLTNLATLAVHRLELDLSHRIGFGTATSYVDKNGETVDISTGDTLPLFYSAHTLKGTATTYRNRLANNPKLSKGALESMERLIVEETLNQFGEKKAMTFDILWTTDDPNTVNTAKEYLQSTADITGSNAGVVNVYASKYRHVILPLIATTAAGLTDTTKRYYWGLASSANSTMYLGIWEEAHLKTPSEGNNGEDFSTDDWQYGVRAGFGICTVNGTYIKCSTGDGVA